MNVPYVLGHFVIPNSDIQDLHFAASANMLSNYNLLRYFHIPTLPYFCSHHTHTHSTPIISFIITTPHSYFHWTPDCYFH